MQNPSHQIHIRVRYCDTDGQGFVHHSNYLHYFEEGRVELLRSRGCSYRDLEAQGFFLVVAEMHCQYKAPARFDDELTLTTTETQRKRASIEHEYELRRGNDILATGRSVIACVDKSGSLQRLPAL